MPLRRTLWLLFALSAGAGCDEGRPAPASAPGASEAQAEPLDLPSRYTLRFRQRIERFGASQGTRVRDGAHVASISFSPDGIELPGAVRLPWGELGPHAFHDYELTVHDGQGELAIDGVIRGLFTLAPSPGPDGVEHWQRGAAARIEREESWLSANEGYALALELDADGGRVALATPAPSASKERDPLAVSPGARMAWEAPCSGDAQTTTLRLRMRGRGPRQLIADAGAFQLALRLDEHGLTARERNHASGAEEPVTLRHWRDAAQAHDTHELRLVSWRDARTGPEVGKAMLYVDGALAGEWNLPLRPSGAAELSLDNEGDGPLELERVRVRCGRPEAPHVIFDDFEQDRAAAPPARWTVLSAHDRGSSDAFRVEAEGGGQALWVRTPDGATATALLHTSSQLGVFEGRFEVGAIEPGGHLDLVLRHNTDDARLFVRLRGSGCAVLMERLGGSATRADYARDDVAERTLSPCVPVSLIGARHRFVLLSRAPTQLRFCLDEDRDRCAAAPLLASDDVQHQARGAFALVARGATARFDDVRAESETPLLRGVLRHELPSRDATAPRMNGDIVAVGSALWAGDREQGCYVSHDGGAHFEAADVACDFSMLRLADGRVLKLSREPTGREAHCEGPDPEAQGPVYAYFVHTSSDGLHWRAAGADAAPLLETACGMISGRTSQAPNGRIFLTVGTGVEGTGGVRIYHSDDGERWEHSGEQLSRRATGLDVEEAKVVHAGRHPGDSRVKAYLRSDRGALYESVADASESPMRWSAPRRSPFRSKRTSFAPAYDPESGATFMAWEYESPAERPNAGNPPRERVSLAVSHDGTETWQLIGDVDDFEGHPYRHMNHSLRVIGQSLWLVLERKDARWPYPPLRRGALSAWTYGPYKLRLWRFDLEQLHGRWEFSGTR